MPEFDTPLKSKWQRKWLAMDAYHADVQGAADHVVAYIGRWHGNRRVRCLLVLMGDSGCGKTHLAKKILAYTRAAYMIPWEDEKWPRPPTQAMVAWPEIVDEFNAKNFNAMSDLLERDLLIIDDVGAEIDPFKSGDCVNKLCQILTQREKKFTVVTTNIPPEKWAERWDARVADRLHRNARHVNMFGVPSYAQVLGERRVKRKGK